MRGGSVLRLTRLFLRLRCGFLSAWIVSLVALTALFPPVFASYYPALAERAPLVQNMQSTMSTRAMYGALESPGTIGQLAAWDGGAWATVLAAVLAVLLFNSMHRSAEDSAHTELVRAMGVSKMAVGVAALLVSLVVGLVLGLGCFGVLWLENLFIDELSTGGAFSFGVVTFLTYMAFSLFAGTISVTLPTAVNANRMGLMAVAVAFVVRALADVEDLVGLNWVSPLGWRGIIKPYTDDNLGAATLFTFVCAAWTIAWLVLEFGREYGRGRLMPRRRRNPRQHRVLGPVSLRWLLDRGQVCVWGIAVVVLSAFLSSLQDFSDSEVLKQSLLSDDLQEGFLAQIAQLVGMLIAIAAMHLVLRHRSDERERLVDLARAVGVRRWMPLGAASIIALLTAVILVLVGTVAGIAGAFPLADDPGAAARSILYGFLSQLGPILALTGMTVLFVGLIPRFALWAWAPLAYCVLVVFLGEALELPDWAMDLSVFQHPLFAGELTERGWVPLLMAGIGVALAAAGLFAASRREVR